MLGGCGDVWILSSYFFFSWYSVKKKNPPLARKVIRVINDKVTRVIWPQRVLPCTFSIFKRRIRPCHVYLNRRLCLIPRPSLNASKPWSEKGTLRVDNHKCQLRTHRSPSLFSYCCTAWHEIWSIYFVKETEPTDNNDKSAEPRPVPVHFFLCQENQHDAVPFPVVMLYVRLCLFYISF